MLRLYDTLSGTMKSVEAANGKQLGFYCCGPTVYAAAHIGNFRTFVAQDVFRRVVELGGLRTKHVRNITDVDDKTIRNSVAQGIPLIEYTQLWTKKFHDDCTALNCLPPHVEPSAVGHIAEQIELVESLIAKNHAYRSEDGSVYFRISSYAEYGKLAHLDRQSLNLGQTAQTRADTDEYEKDSVADFVLWKGRKAEDGDNYWLSPWGEGRPGWHLECSAMSHKYLGATFDLHSGGVDLIFPHHENEIAQSRCACGGDCARHWFHVTHLLVDGAKMSKSLGNMYTLDQLQEMGYTPAALRYLLSSASYRRPLNFTLTGLKDAQSALNKLGRFDKELSRAAQGAKEPQYKDLCKRAPLPTAPFTAAWDSLEDDLNLPEALGHVFTTIKGIKPAELSVEEATATWYAFRLITEALGLTLTDPDADIEVPEEVRALAEERWEARAAKNWARSDELRDELSSLGWSIKDGKDGYQITKA